MFEKYNIGIMGSGNIAGIMADTIRRMKNVKLYAVGSRTQVKADAFAGKYGCKKAYGSYEELVQDKKIDLIYIATPHSEHYENAKLCILNGKPVLCEKAFTVNAKQAQELVNLAREKEVFLAEAMWIRYMPMATKIQEVLGSGVLGELKTLTANLGYAIDQVPRLSDPALAGGALLDVGVYPLNFAAMLFGHSIDHIDGVCTYNPNGVDEQNSMTIRYSDGKVAILNSSMVSVSDRQGIVYGTKGYAIIDNINCFEEIRVYDASGKQLASYKAPKHISGYEYEVEAALQAIERKELECVQMPHSETIRMMKLMDELRRQWGIFYPMEKADTPEDAQEISAKLSAEAQAETPVEAMTELSAETPAEACTDTPAEACTETPVEATTETTAETDAESASTEQSDAETLMI